MKNKMHQLGFVAVLVGLIGAGCGDSGTQALPAPPPVPTPPADFIAAADDFDCIQDWERVRNIRVTNKLGLLEETLEVARNPQPGVQYPVGTIIQLFPGEAMVKRAPDFDPANNNWEYFELLVSPEGTSINVRGRDEVINMFGGNCLSCHADAREFDFICEKGRGCVDLPIGDEAIAALQEADPRCQ